MQIKELIKKLQQYDPELTALVSGYEMGYDRLEEENIEMKAVFDKQITYTCGRYEDYDLYVDILNGDEVLKDSLVALILGK